MFFFSSKSILFCTLFTLWLKTSLETREKYSYPNEQYTMPDPLSLQLYSQCTTKQHHQCLINTHGLRDIHSILWGDDARVFGTDKPSPSVSSPAALSGGSCDTGPNSHKEQGWIAKYLGRIADNRARTRGWIAAGGLGPHVACLPPWLWKREWEPQQHQHQVEG